MIGNLTLAPLIPWPWLALLAAAAIVLVAIAAVRRGRAWPLRAGVMTVLVVALLDPNVVRDEREARPDIAIVVVDASPSQRTGDRPQRTEAALAAVEADLARLRSVETRVVRAEGESDAGGTRLFAAVERALAEVPRTQRAGVVLITDGQVHDAPGFESADAEAAAAAIGAPLHVLLTGRPDERDRRIVIERAPAYGLVGQPIAIRYRVDQPGEAGTADGEPITIRFRVDGADSGTALARPGRSQTFAFAPSHAGPSVLEIETDSAPDELSAVNNRAVVTVNGVRERLRALLVSGQPHPGERMWRNLLKSDPAVDLVHFTILRPPEKDDTATIDELSLIAFPTQELFEEKLYDFDLIVFDRYVMRGVLPWRYLAKTAEYLENGGAVLLAVGPEFAEPESLYRTPLGRVMPAVPTGRIIEAAFRPQVTELGRRHPVTTSLPGESVVGDTDAEESADTPQWGRWFRIVETEALGGHVLMRGAGGAPLLAVSQAGEGRIAQLASDHLWLWARGYEGGGPHAELTRRLVHWLMKEPELEAERLSAAADDGKLIVERRSLSPDPVGVEVTDPAGETRSMTLAPGSDGVARGEVAAPAPGLYRVDDGTHTALAASGPLNPREYADLRATTERLAPVAEASGGGVGWTTDGVPDIRHVRPGRDSVGDGWIGIRRNDASIVTGVRRDSLLPGFAVLILTLAGLGAAWWREGR